MGFGIYQKVDLCFMRNLGGSTKTRKRVWGCAALKTPFSHFSCSSQGPYSSKSVSSQDPLLRKCGNFSIYSLNFCPNFSSQTPKFGNFQFTSPPLSEVISVGKPHTSEIRAAHTYLKHRPILNTVYTPFHGPVSPREGSIYKTG